jgi:uncharacterized protein involved in cysteine biosynthesis
MQRRATASRRASLRFGATLPWRAARLVARTPGLLLWSVLPIVVTLVLYYQGIGFLIDRAQALLAGWFVDWGLEPGGLLFWALELMTRSVLLLVAAVSFAFASSVVASPFNDRLALATERHARPPLPAAAPAGAEAQLRVIALDLLKATAAGVASLVALLVAWIPVVNLFSFAAAFLLVCFQYLSYPQTRRGVGLRAGLAFLWRHVWSCAGFGASVSVLFALPILSSLALPLAVVGGTLLAARCPGGDGRLPLR